MSPFVYLFLKTPVKSTIQNYNRCDKEVIFLQCLFLDVLSVITSVSLETL